MIGQAATILSCAMTLATPQPALAGQRILFNLAVGEALAAEMRAGQAPEVALRFSDSRPGESGWIVYNGVGAEEPNVMLGRVTRLPNSEKPLAMRWGLAVRRAEANHYSFEEKMRGRCDLVSESELR